MNICRNTSGAICLTLLVAVLACDRRGQERAKQELSEAREETRSAVHEAKRETRKLAGEIKTASERTQTNGMDIAEAKLGQAAILAKVKAKLASDVGVGTVGSVDVEVQGQVVTLRGHVSSSEQRTRAEEAVKEVPDVASVVNRLTVER